MKPCEFSGVSCFPPAKVSFVSVDKLKILKWKGLKGVFPRWYLLVPFWTGWCLTPGTTAAKFAMGPGTPTLGVGRPQKLYAWWQTNCFRDRLWKLKSCSWYWMLGMMTFFSITVRHPPKTQLAVRCSFKSQAKWDVFFFSSRGKHDFTSFQLVPRVLNKQLRWGKLG